MPTFIFPRMAPAFTTEIPDDLFSDIDPISPVPDALEAIFPFASHEALGDLYSDAMSGNTQGPQGEQEIGCPNLGPLGEMMGFPYHCQGPAEKRARSWNAENPPAAGITVPYASDLVARVLAGSSPISPLAPAYPGGGSGLLELWT